MAGPVGGLRLRLERGSGQDVAVSAHGGRQAGSLHSGTQSGLAAALDQSIVPRLIMARRANQPNVVRRHVAVPLVDEFTALLLLDEPQPAMDCIQSLHAAGVPVHQLLLNVLAPAAERLGEFWVEDRCHFGDVTLGVCRLHQLLHQIESRAAPSLVVTTSIGRILLCNGPQDQHGFGVSVVAALFRRAGWDVWHDSGLPARDVAALVRRHFFDVVGVSVACSASVGELDGMIADIRERSRNRALPVLLGGPAVVADPSMWMTVGADAAATDGRQAVRRASDLLRARNKRRAADI